MTVKELQEELNKFNDSLIVMIPHENTSDVVYFPYTSVQHVTRGFNEFDGAVFIEGYYEEDDD